MLNFELLNLKYQQNQIIPLLLDLDDPDALNHASNLIEIYRTSVTNTRGMIDDELTFYLGNDSRNVIIKGLVKLLDDRCEFVTVSCGDPEEIRESLFNRAAQMRKTLLLGQRFDRDQLIRELALQLDVPTGYIEHSLYADLPSEKVLSRIRLPDPVELLQEYNRSLIQTILLRSASIQIIINDGTTEDYRYLFRLIKFFRLIFHVQRLNESTYQITLDGPMNLFTVTNRYGLQIANLFPIILRWTNFELHAKLIWGTSRKEKFLVVKPDQRLVSNHVETLEYIPSDLVEFFELFQRQILDFEIVMEPVIIPIGQNVWLPDFQLLHKASGHIIYVEILGYWRYNSVYRRLEMLQQANVSWILASSRSLFTDLEINYSSLPNLYIYHQFPSPDEVAERARQFEALHG